MHPVLVCRLPSTTRTKRTSFASDDVPPSPRTGPCGELTFWQVILSLDEQTFKAPRPAHNAAATRGADAPLSEPPPAPRSSPVRVSARDSDSRLCPYVQRHRVDAPVTLGLTCRRRPPVCWASRPPLPSRLLTTACVHLLKRKGKRECTFFGPGRQNRRA